MMPPKPEGVPSIKSVMTPFPWCVAMDDTLVKAKSMMEEHAIRHLPVTEGEQLVGVITDRDLRLIETSTPDRAARGELLVRDACEEDAYTVQLTEPLDRVALEMAKRRVGLALVVKDTKLVGIFTVTDACRCLGDFLRTMLRGDGDDDVA